MGRTMFTCPVSTVERFDAAVAHIHIHNMTEMKPTGKQFTEEEFARIDPPRAAMCAAINQAMPGAINGCMERWTRGEDLLTERAYAIRYRDEPWLVIPNQGGGACTTQFLRKHFSGFGWWGSDGKPDGWIEASVIAAGDLGEIRKELFPSDPEVCISTIDEILQGLKLER
jgi:hypothetical protein